MIAKDVNKLKDKSANAKLQTVRLSMPLLLLIIKHHPLNLHEDIVTRI